MIRILNAPNTKPKLPCLFGLLTAAAKQRAVDRTEFIPSEFHGIPP
jgi:hypothetical protein